MMRKLTLLGMVAAVAMVGFSVVSCGDGAGGGGGGGGNGNSITITVNGIPSTADFPFVGEQNVDTARIDIMSTDGRFYRSNRPSYSANMTFGNIRRNMGALPENSPPFNTPGTYSITLVLFDATPFAPREVRYTSLQDVEITNGSNTIQFDGNFTRQ